MLKRKILPKSFYFRDATTLAKALLGKILVHKAEGQLLAGRIVETESYHEDDPAAHSFVGKTNRTKAMFEDGGISYVYFIYGVHYCFNVVAGKKDIGEAVLVRALEPLEGIESMRENRGIEDIRQLTNGPAKLAQALDIDRDEYGLDLSNSDLEIWDEGKQDFEIVSTTRIGITKAQEVIARFYIKGNEFVSRK